MAKRPLSDSPTDAASAPSDVQVTVFRLRDDRGLDRWLESCGDRIPKRLRQVAITLSVAIVGVMFAVMFAVVASRGPRGAIWGVRETGPAGVAAAYGYPSGCLRVRISAANPAFARADFDRPKSCGYDVAFPTALFHRFDGEWHPVLYAVSYSCPVSSIPAAVQKQLSLCPRRALR